MRFPICCAQFSSLYGPVGKYRAEHVHFRMSRTEILNFRHVIGYSFLGLRFNAARDTIPLFSGNDFVKRFISKFPDFTAGGLAQLVCRVVQICRRTFFPQPSICCAEITSRCFERRILLMSANYFGAN